MPGIVSIPAGDALTALAAALVVGATSSAHCFLMCGPLACAASPRGELKVTTGYHLGRVLAYTLLGLLAGTLGGGVAKVLAVEVQPYLPWVMAAVLVGGALGLVKRVGRIPGLSHVTSFIARSAAHLPPLVRGTTMGALTPLLPCGLLYGVIAAALTAGSAVGGAAVLGGFALGATPALLLPQLPGGFLKRGAAQGFVLTRALPLVAAAALVYRALAVSTGGSTCH